MRQSQDERIASYKETELSDAAVHDLTIRAVDASVIPVTRIRALLGEWRHPRYPEFAEDGRTAWRFFNGVTEILKGNLPALPRRTQALHGLQDSACGLIEPSRN